MRSTLIKNDSGKKRKGYTSDTEMNPVQNKDIMYLRMTLILK